VAHAHLLIPGYMEDPSSYRDRVRDLKIQLERAGGDATIAQQHQDATSLGLMSVFAMEHAI
jgi:hypothetical protein